MSICTGMCVCAHARACEHQRSMDRTHNLETNHQCHKTGSGLESPRPKEKENKADQNMVEGGQ